MHRSCSLLVALLVAVPASTTLAAQTRPCVGLNDANNNVTNVITARNSSNPGEWAWGYTATASLTVRGLRVYTGNRYTDSHMKLSIWSDNAATNTPNAELAQGTFLAPKNPGKSWVGTNFDAAVRLTKGTRYWIVWTETGWSTPPFDSSGNQKLPTARRFGGSWSAGGAQALKCRIYCSPIDVQGIRVHGKACGGAKTGLGTSFAQLTPTVGNSKFRVEGTGFPPNATAILAMGTVKAWPSLPFGPLAPGCYSNTDIKFTIAGKTGQGNIRSTTGPAGHVTFNLPIPNNSALKGVFVGLQIAAADATSKNTLPLVFSNGTQATIL